MTKRDYYAVTIKYVDDDVLDTHEYLVAADSLADAFALGTEVFSFCYDLKDVAREVRVRWVAESNGVYHRNEHGWASLGPHPDDHKEYV